MADFVLDASATAAWVLPDEENALANAVVFRLRDSGALVPAIWWYEVRNLPVVNERRGRTTREKTTAFLASLSRLRILIDRLPLDSHVMDLARAHHLSYYDAAYLELALREQLPLATVDKPLRRAAEACGLQLLHA